MGAETHIDIRNLNSSGGGMGNCTLQSPDNSITVESIQNGHEIKVSQKIIDTINSKQDINNVGGLLTSGVESLWFGLNLSGYPDTTITGVHVGDYIPLFEINAYNGGKSQLGFEIISREDTAGYYSKFFFVSRAGNYLLIRTDYYNKPVLLSGYFDKNAIVVVQDSNRYLICKKTMDTGFDAWIVNQLYRDTKSYCDIYRYTTFTTERYTDPDIRRASPITVWRNKNIATSGVLPTELDSDSINVNYDNTVSQASVTNVQAALDDLYQKYNSIINN